MHSILQFTRYSFVGLTTNLVLYLMYLFLTSVGMGYKSAMSLLYVLGVLTTFVFNRNWSFRDDGGISITLFRYLAVYLSGYVINFLVLFWLVDVRGLPHQWVQGVMIFSLAIYLFLLQKFWVFRDSKTS
jgi:putative flippase GtrA